MSLTALAQRSPQHSLCLSFLCHSAMDKSHTVKLFVGNLSEGTTPAALKDLFSRYAPVIEADIIKNFGFVHIDADAGRGKIDEILRELNGHDLNGSQIRVQKSTSGVRQKPGMSGDQCYRCGQGGHWSRECPQYPDHPDQGYGGG